MEQFQRALELAARALTLSNPNPRVGCVIAAADGRVLGEGFTQQRGGAHAEVMALRDAAARGNDVAGSTVYVTLEPCAHHGRTPPCCDALVAARVGRVLVALRDPNPLVAGQGMARLQAAGIAVDMAPPGVAQQARELNIGFLRRMEHGLPWVRLKTAASLDGMTALANGASQWITGEAARADVQHWRARACAVLSGIGTVLADDPLLNVRLPEVERQPHLAVLDSQLRMPATARLLAVPRRAVWVYTLPQTLLQQPARVRRLQEAGAEVRALPPGPDGLPDLRALLADLGQREVNELHVEAGATLNGALLQQGLVSEWLAYVAPVLTGPGRPLARLPAQTGLEQALRWQTEDVRQIGPDLRWRMRPAAT